MKLLLVTFVLLGLGCLSSAKRKSDCGPCDKSSCPEPVNCVADTVLDECNCCEQCGLAEGELCDLPKQDYKYGRCGKKLECRERSDAPGESTCFCKHTKPICGSDGVTYRNICNLKEIKVLQNKDDLKVADKGPCKYAPKIVSLPEHQKNHTGTSVAISCEAEGYPIPSIDWFVTRSNDESIRLPEDDDKVSLYTRGGPEKYRITGWIQVMKMEKHHEGDYTCVATNKLGMQKAMARLIVLDENDERDRGL